MPDERPSRFTVDEAARRAGHFRWLERRLFEVLGGWVGTTPEPEVKARLEVHAARHAWHADVWGGLVPDARHLDPDALTVPATPDLVALVDAVEEATATADRLAGVYRVVVPHLVAAYGAHLDACSPVTDGPTIRWLKLVLADEVDDWREGEAVLQGLVTTPEAAERLAARTGRLAALLVTAGGIAGPGTLTPPPA